MKRKEIEVVKFLFNNVEEGDCEESSFDKACEEFDHDFEVDSPVYSICMTLCNTYVSYDALELIIENLGEEGTLAQAAEMLDNIS